MKKLALLIVFALVGADAFGATVVRRSQVEKVVTPGLSTTAYSSGDFIGVGGASQITGVPYDSGGGTVTLAGVQLIDTDKQSSALDLVFFDRDPSEESADNAAFDIADASLLTSFVGFVNVPAANYAAFNDSSAATVKDINLPLKLKADSGSLWVAVVSRGTPTYTAVSAVKVKLLFTQE